MYKITFESQPRQGEPDYENGSIVLTEEDYKKLPELSIDIFNEECKFSKGNFSEQIRNPNKSFPAIWISNDAWDLGEASDLSGGYIDSSIYWVFVCLDVAADIWIGFQFYDLTTVEDSFTATVGVSFPSHGEVYRLDSKCKEIVRQFYS